MDYIHCLLAGGLANLAAFASKKKQDRHIYKCCSVSLEANFGLHWFSSYLILRQLPTFLHSSIPQLFHCPFPTESHSQRCGKWHTNLHLSHNSKLTNSANFALLPFFLPQWENGKITVFIIYYFPSSSVREKSHIKKKSTMLGNIAMK